MSNKKRQPFTISRTNTYRSSGGFLDKSLSSSFEDLNPPLFRKQSSFLSKQSSFNLHDSAFKSHYNIFKTDSNLMPDLLEKYSQDNLQYRDEEFTQQAESFITKVAADRRIPKDLRAKFPLYQILISICKIFMLNEYEIVVFACSLDHCNWRMDEVVLPEESDFLKEFPSNFGVEISDECKRFIMYLLIITFSLKQYLNEKNNVDKIQAYCEKICVNFQTMFNRWTKISSFHKFNYSAPEINRKFKYLSRKEYGDHVTSVKDYNMIVDNIMTLTGSYSSKPKIDCKPIGTHLPSASSNYVSHKSDVFTELASFPVFEAKSLLPEPTPIPGLERSLSKNKTIDFLGESTGLKIPSTIPSFSRQNSISNLLSGLSSVSSVKRQNSFELFDELQRKLLKQDTSSTTNNNSSSNINTSNGHSTTLHQPIPRKDTSGTKLPDLSALTSLLKGTGEGEDLLSIALPILSRKSSTVSQQPPEEIPLPSLSRFNSNFSFLYENK